jgi:hypothetical protein
MIQIIVNSLNQEEIKSQEAQMIYIKEFNHIYDVDCNFVYYIDPNNIGSFGEIKWQDFYKKITMQTQGDITGNIYQL